MSLVKGVSAEYRVENGQTIITLTSTDRVKHKAIECGLGTLQFLREPSRGGGKQGLDSSIFQPQQVPFDESVGSDGSQVLTIRLDRFWPAAGLMRAAKATEQYTAALGGYSGRVGEFCAPTIHIAASSGGDFWVALLRNPWSPFRLEIGKRELAISRDDGRASISVSPSEGGGFSGDLWVSGTAFKKVSLSLRRTLGAITMDEPLAEVDEAGTGKVEWKPVMRSFDLLFVNHTGWPAEQLTAAVELAKGVGTSFYPQEDFVLSDSPLIQYTLSLKGEAGKLKHDEDSAKLALNWQ